MNQPTAPCSPPKTNNRASAGHHMMFDAGSNPEPKHRHQENKADQPAPETVGPFEPENMLEPGQAETRVHQRILRDLLIEREKPMPLRVARRRECPHQRRPLHDRQCRNLLTAWRRQVIITKIMPATVKSQRATSRRLGRVAARFHAGGVREVMHVEMASAEYRSAAAFQKRSSRFSRHFVHGHGVIAAGRSRAGMANGRR